MERERELLEEAERQQFEEDGEENLEELNPDESDSFIEISSHYSSTFLEIEELQREEFREYMYNAIQNLTENLVD